MLAQERSLLSYVGQFHDLLNSEEIHCGAPIQFCLCLFNFEMQLVGLQAAAVSTLAGTLASLPFSLAVDGGWGLGTLLSQGGIVLSCLLFGVTYRYIIRRDLGNLQLKSGAVAAFGLVRGKKTQCYRSLGSGQFLIPPLTASYAPRFARLLNAVLLIEHMKTMCKMSK